MEARRLPTAIFVVVAALVSCIGCGGPVQKKQAVAAPATYPSVSEIPPIPTYQETGGPWSTAAVCWVGMADDAKWSWKLPFTSSGSVNWVRNNTSRNLCRLIGEELQTIGYPVRSYKDEYLTREKRLAIEKLVFFQHFNITKTKVREGYCMDMELTLRIVNNPEQNEGTLCKVWGRTMMGPDETRKWVDIYRDCVKNMRLVPELRAALNVEAK